jgi:N-acetylneuraminic acid mutarotase
MVTGRATQTATLLSNGTVLVAGGANAAGDALASSELFTVRTGWKLTGKMNSAHAEHTATLLTSGKVVVAGGENISGFSQSIAEIYAPLTGKWTVTGSLHTARQEHTAVLLGNGNVLVAGGTVVTANPNPSFLASAELYNPTTGVWSNTGSMKNARAGHTATLLVNGLVLAAAGSNAVNELNSAELYTP